MTGLTAAASVDVVARITGISGLVLAVGGLVLTWYLWHRSGPKLKVTAFVRAETGTVHIDVSNSGRLTATVRQILLRDHLSIPTSGAGTTAISRWALQVEPASGDPLPREVAPERLSRSRRRCEDRPHKGRWNVYGNGHGLGATR
jgi:hypothetical protein